MEMCNVVMKVYNDFLEVNSENMKVYSGYEGVK